MSLEEITIHMRKASGEPFGFTLMKNTCTISRVVDKNIVDLHPGDLIISVNETNVSEETVRDILRSCRDGIDFTLTVARRPMYYRRSIPSTDGTNVLGPYPRRKGIFSCFPLWNRLRGRKRRNFRTSSICEMSPAAVGSVASLGSGMRPVDLGKLHKEGAGTMWYIDRSSSLTR